MNSALLKRVLQFIRFGMAGLPGFVLAIGLNILLIERLHWAKPLAYLLVMWVQMTLGYIICRVFVFEEKKGHPSFLKGYWQFTLSMAMIRLAEWSFYTALVELAHVPYVLAQICCPCIFLVLKFVSANAIFKPDSRQA